ncbi:unnamed protein product [Cylindrotheca closterium]|uniref:Tr-type G domain-containing protein n=1 Tax=Cylindrotheca closterium TaxID=2856 RepID=A0AAD2JL45_9STRA|nr:unnamed protein product [Cylindrotheca closterium]
MSGNSTPSPDMKTPPTFQIKVAIIGNVSAGKTTVLNALFRDKYGEVSMKRTTAGVNEFAILSQEEWASVSDSPRESKSVLKEITEDNLELRASDQVQTKRFEIELEEPLCEMRKDTQLVIVDIPGVNEADMSKKYKDYVENHWNTFDCAVVVMDGRQGVNTEEQVSLLRFVKTNLESKKDIPVVILCNKVDDPDDKEQAELVLEAQCEVEKIFRVSDRQKSLQDLLDTADGLSIQVSNENQVLNSTSKKQKIGHSEHVSPVFIPISGITAFIFQICSSMTLKKFREFDEDLIAKLGRERIGKRKWKKLSKEEQVQQAHKAVSDPEGYQEGLEDSNFHKFLKALSLLVGGDATQEQLIKKQIQVLLENIPCGHGMVSVLEKIHKSSAALSGCADSSMTGSANDVPKIFWKVQANLRERCLAESEPLAASDGFVPLASELLKYKEFALSLGWEDEAELAVASFENVVREYLESVKHNPGFTAKLRAVYGCIKETSLAEGEPSTISTIKQDFKRLYQELKEERFKRFTRTDKVHELSDVADEVIEYSRLAKEAGWKDEEAFARETFKEVVLEQVRTICVKACQPSPSSTGVHYGNAAWETGFESLAGVNWTRLLRSILLLRAKKDFYTDFGNEIVWMEQLVDYKIANQSRYNLQLQNTESGLVQNKNGDLQEPLVIPKSFDDPNHFGHLAWRYCQFMEGSNK